jgi:hypothetical protein
LKDECLGILLLGHELNRLGRGRGFRCPVK